MRVFMGHKGPVTTMAMSPDGKYLASAGESEFTSPSSLSHTHRNILSYR